MSEHMYGGQQPQAQRPEVCQDLPTLLRLATSERLDMF